MLIKTNDITNLRTIFDTKFNKIEKTVERIHLDLKRSFHEIEMQNNNEVILKITIPEKSARKEENDDKEIEKSLSLNFEKENNEIMDKKAEMTPKLSKEVFTFFLRALRL